MSADAVYATPRVITDINDCYFYHTIDIPQHGLVQGEWDLRENASEYLGNVDFKGKRVLEVGTASGFFCFHMESKGAEMVSYDLSDKHDWDVVPYCGVKTESFIAERKNHIRNLNNGYWFSHRAFKSKAKVVYGSVYSIPKEIGPVDIATFGSVLLHVRDPFYAMQNGLRLAREAVIITDLPPQPNRLLRGLKKLNIPIEAIQAMLRKPHIQFMPDFRKQDPRDTWWRIPPEIIVEFIGVLGFEDAQIHYHTKSLYQGRPTRLYTIVGKRTKGKF